MTKLYLDVESAGLKGPLHLIQYSVDRGPVKILRVSKKPNDKELLALLENEETTVVGFNLGFDLWKLYQHYRRAVAWKCSTLDLYQHTLRSKPFCYYPILGIKEVVKINRIPLKYSEQVVEKTCQYISSLLPPIAKICVKRSQEKVDSYSFCTLSFSVRVPAKLKELAKCFLSLEEAKEILHLEDVLRTPEDFGWKEDKRFPNVGSDEREKYKEVRQANEDLLDDPEKGPVALKYSIKDVEYLWKLEDWLVEKGNVVEVDDNDVCTHIVAFTRYWGFPVDDAFAKKLSKKFLAEMKDLKRRLGVDLESPKERLALLKQHAVIPEAVIGTGKDKLQILLEEEEAGILTEEGIRIAKEMSKYKPLAQRRKQLEVVTEGDGRIYPDFVVHGTATGRMRGTGGLNFQGIARDGDIRKCFLTSQGGDFDGLEWCIAANHYQDQEMLRGLREGIDPHTFAVHLLSDRYADWSYEELIKLKGKDKEFDEERAAKKRINFAVLYQAGPFKISKELGCTPEEAERKMEETYFAHYESMARVRGKLEEKFCTADFDGWVKGSVLKMGDRVKGLFGDIRYVCFERHLAIFFWESSDSFGELASGDKEEVIRREEKGLQTMKNAIRSAVLGAASGIQKAITRQLGNYPIQNAGAVLTKKLMRRIWEEHHLPMMNVHDEIDIPADFPGDEPVEVVYENVKKTVDSFLAEYGKRFEGLSMEWKQTKNWSEK